MGVQTDPGSREVCGLTDSVHLLMDSAGHEESVWTDPIILVLMDSSSRDWNALIDSVYYGWCALVGPAGCGMSAAKYHLQHVTGYLVKPVTECHSVAVEQACHVRAATGSHVNHEKGDY